MRMLEHRTAKGTGEAVKASYETAWERTRARIDREIATGDSLFSILARMNRLALGDHEVDFWRKQPGVAPLARRVLDAWDVDVDERPSPYIPAVINGRYGVRTAFSPMRYLAERIGDANVVVEFGSGWSANLFQLYLLLGNQRSEGLKYIGAEYTEAGRGGGSVLAAHDGRIDYTAVPFDWTQPDLSFLADLPRPLKVVAFSHHSIEQVERISEKFHPGLRDIADELTVVHFEPVGWQRDAELLERRVADDADYYRRLAHDLGMYPKRVRNAPRSDLDITTVEAQVRGAAWWSFTRRYNINLLEIVDGLRPRDWEVEDVLFDYDSLRNPLNPSTLLTLRAKPKG